MSPADRRSDGEQLRAAARAAPERLAALVRAYSIEMTAKDGDALREARDLIPQGTSVSITFLAGETAPARVAAAKQVRSYGFHPKPHISARRLTSAEELEAFLADLACQAQIDRAFVVAGDLGTPAGPYFDALAVIKSGLLGRYGVRHVGISGYPEGHPDFSEEKLWQALSDKQQALTDLGHSYDIVTQFGFDAKPVLDWLSKLRDSGIAAPVRVGVPGPASVKTLLRFAARCGVAASASVMAKYGVSITQLVMTAGPNAFITELAGSLDPGKHGEVFLHFYPFGGLAKTARWVHDFSAGLPDVESGAEARGIGRTIRGWFSGSGLR
ncbi:MAG: methylenetetrahydrofolate reductase [Hyphomicrobiaceae bacterium]|nr:methylenetetrahydrofolate reductase [Hyphomicrobiaceae bacterium]